MRFYLVTLFVLLFLSCSEDSETSTISLFSSYQGPEVGISFENRLTVNDSMNYFKYGYFYMGGGVAAGDLNGDKLPELFFTGNMSGNELYLNLGDKKFENINAPSIEGSDGWHTGCAMGDVNEDGLLDLMVSVGGVWSDTKNQIYINKGTDESGIPQFSEEAESLGLADKGNSIQMIQIDYDKDGDLDVYVLNYPITALDLKGPEYIRLVDNPKWETSDHLYRNDGNGNFTDVTEEAGVLEFGLGIGVVSSDFNEDGWPDLYVSNDFQTPDFFYINNRDGSFSNKLSESFMHTSFFGMGVDVGDINNDLRPDLVQVDMTSDDNYRSKANMSSMDIPGFELMINSSLGYQYMYNNLQLNNGLNTDSLPFFSDIAMYSGVASTDWSWSCLFSDFDMDGLSDLYITNGTRKDINNKDYFNWLKRTDTRMKIKYDELEINQLVDRMPSQAIDNYMFKNTGEKYAFANKDWNISFEGFSNGACYADLDSDGDLDLVVNNIDTTASIFINNADLSQNHFLKVRLVGEDANAFSIGAKVIVYSDSISIMRELNPVRGYQSSMEHLLHFGLGTRAVVDSLVVIWPDYKQSRKYDVLTNQVMEIKESEEIKTARKKDQPSPTLFEPASDPPLVFVHKENDYDDYDREVLLPHKMSSFGPALVVGDINDDKYEDVFVGGASGQASVLFVADGTGRFKPHYLDGENHEDDNALFCDFNDDGFMDLLIASGGNEVNELSDDYYSQRIYYNSASGLSRTADYFESPVKLSASAIAAISTKAGAAPEIIYGGRQVPGNYPLPASSHIVNRHGMSNIQGLDSFKDLGMVTDMETIDLDGDGSDELLIVGEWMAPKLISLDNGEIKEISIGDLSEQVGWWQEIIYGDFDVDGDQDLVLTNLGTNYKYTADDEETFDIYSNDFNNDKDMDIVLSFHQDGDQYPLRGKQCSSQQLPELSKKFPNYHAFASSNLEQIYGGDDLKSSLKYEANNFQHIYVENVQGKLKWKPLSAAFQRYALNAGVAEDLDGDGDLDIVMAGNIFDSEAETPRADGCYGAVAINDGQGNFSYIPNHISGLYLPYEVRALSFLRSGNEQFLLAGVNDGEMKVYRVNKL